MKVVLLSFYHPDLVKGGGQQVAVNLHRAFVKKGMDSMFIGADNNVPNTMRTQATPITKLTGRKNEYVCHVGSFNSEFMLSDDPWATKGLFDLIKQHSPNVIYIHHFLMIGLDFVYFLKLSFPKTKFIFTAHEFLSICMRDGHLLRTDGGLCNSHTPTDCIKCFPHVPVTYFTLRNITFEKFYAIFDYVVTPSVFMHARLASVYPELKGKLVCIPNGSFYAADIKKSIAIKSSAPFKKSVAFFGQLLHDKGIYDLLLAIEEMGADSSDLNVDFWGGNLELNPPEFRQKFLDKLAELSAKPNVAKIRLMGEYKNSDAPEIMRRYEILAFPAKWPETFSLVFSEALLTGKLIVVPNIGAFKERAKNYRDRVITYDDGSRVGFGGALNSALRKKNQIISKLAEDLSIETMANSYFKLA